MAMITDIRHLIDDDPKFEVPPRLWKLREFFGHIVRVGTAKKVPHLTSGIPCRKRPNRRRCPGHIVVRTDDTPLPAVFWSCNTCQDGGQITGFRGCPDDLSQFSSLQVPEPDERRLRISLSFAEYEALMSGDLIPYDPDSLRAIYSARNLDGEAVVLEEYEGALDCLRDAVAADANHEPRRSRQKLIDSVFGKLSVALDGT